MIVNHELIIQHLAQWLADYAKSVDKYKFVVGFRGTRSDALLLKICEEARKLNGAISTAVHSCSIGVRVNQVYYGQSTLMHGDGPEAFYLVCHLKAEELNGLILGPIDRTFGLYYRGYGKRAEGTCDIFPLFDLEYPEIVTITDKIWTGINWEDYKFLDLEDVDGISFCNEVESLCGIITADTVPSKHPRWPYFVAYQKSIIARVHQREKSTRHKKLERPFPVLSDKPQLICGRK